jgi:hypothetical protein
MLFEAQQGGDESGDAAAQSKAKSDGRRRSGGSRKRGQAS